MKAFVESLAQEPPAEKGDDDGFAHPECFVVDERRAEHAERRHRGREEQAVEGAGDRDAERKRDECFAAQPLWKMRATTVT